MFTKDHPYSKAFNKKTLKVSYSCMPNSQSIFKEATQHYQEAIRANGYDHELAYSQ